MVIDATSSLDAIIPWYRRPSNQWNKLTTVEQSAASWLCDYIVERVGGTQLDRHIGHLNHIYLPREKIPHSDLEVEFIREIDMVRAACRAYTRTEVFAIAKPTSSNRGFGLYRLYTPGMLRVELFELLRDVPDYTITSWNDDGGHHNQDHDGEI